MDYGTTLNLLKTDFPMRGNLPNKEPEIEQWWDEINIYQKVQESKKGKPTFILHDGPPYANGDIHIGHALNKILKDIIVRFKTMQGYNAPYVPGWDTHGLPIEHAIIKNEKINRHEIGPIEFRNRCRDYALSYVEKQKGQFKRLGIRGDFENPYITLKPEYEARQLKVFGEMAKKGLIYKGLKPVYWSPSSESALAEAEIEYKEKRSASIYVAFEVVDGKGKLPEGSNVVIWTTTPWTIPANLAISIHPEFDYVLYKVESGQYLVAKELLDHVKEEIGFEHVEIVKEFKGEELEGVVTKHPFYDRISPVILGEHVTLEAGTGCVHTAPGHGEDDFYVGQKYGLDVLSPIDDQGKFTKEAPGFEGLFYEDANKEVTKKLAEVGKLLKLGFIKHQYPHDWRSKQPVIYRATEQWFASIEPIRQTMLEEIKNVKWVPHWGELRLHNMVADRGDWCISRQRIWGVPIPIFYCKDCGETILNDQTIHHVADLVAMEGSNVWFAKEADELVPEGTSCPSCGGTHFRKETDIMDVWFDSGSSHEGVLEAREELRRPADLYLEGSDQYRGWFNSSLSTSVAVTGKAPYKAVLSHGFTLDGEGRKMSKSLGNVIVPQKIVDQLGADILRLWVASVDYQSDVRISDNILKQISEVYRKIRNTLRFLVGNLEGFNPQKDQVALKEMNELDQFAMMRTKQLIDKVIKGYDAYEFHSVYQSIHNFCTVDMSAFYLDIIKDRLYTQPLHSPTRKAAQTVLYEVLLVLVKLIAPILPHTADEIWKFIPEVNEISVQLTEFPDWSHIEVDQSLMEKWEQFLDVRDEVLKALEVARKDKLIGHSLAAAVTIYPSTEVAKLLNQFNDLDKLFIVSHVDVKEEQAPENAMQLEGLSVHVTQAEGEKCQRCWIVSPEVGHKHPELCPTCAEIVEEHYHDLVTE
ncbi:isoleucine--tRNA ligase [Tepidibacillus decaturensis]|uniref:Isoleucine--tRNA ligase n=1 Tax=Tepidibacillus decaturensis TaxID=1413211 RepID=A0A135L3Y5_9BACI|nr:isoleucine--tRNA ligase [Tepidibacillus decaturensis]KXG43754.1 isoleucine--tRNA ligase [Tepidibacillus decaturensis]